MEAKKNDFSFLKEPQRQSPIAILLILTKFIWAIMRQLWPLLLIFFLNPKRLGESWISIAVAVIGGASALLSIVSYFKFYFYVKGNELVIEKGIFQKVKLNLPLDRIQTINFSQTPIHRFFNVVALEIDTAGSAAKEFSILALQKEKAEAIRSYLVSHKRNDTPIEAHEEFVEHQEEIILRLSPSDLLKIGIGQNHIRSLGIILGTLFGLSQFLEDAFDKKEYEEMRDSLINIIWDSAISLALLAVIAAFLLTLIMTFIRYYDLHFLKTSQGFKIITGLFTRTENAANINKIQLLKWSTNPIKQQFDFFDLRLLQAASTVVRNKQSIYVAGCYSNQLDAVRQTYFPEEQEQHFETRTIHWRIIIRRVFNYGILPAALFSAITLYDKPSNIIWAILWVMFIVITSIIYQRKWRYSIALEGIRTQQGIFGTSYSLLKWHKIQSVKLRQSIFQKRRGLTDLYLYTAAGTLKIPYIEQDIAVALRDYVLYKVESSTQEWM